MGVKNRIRSICKGNMQNRGIRYFKSDEKKLPDYLFFQYFSTFTGQT